MKNLKFTFNWNGKLFCDSFTTIRLTNYYNVGDIVTLCLKDECIDTGKIIGKIETRIEKLTELVCQVDTGYSRLITISLLKSMYKGITDWENTPIYIYTITRKYEEKQNVVGEFYLKKFFGDDVNLELIPEENMKMIKALLTPQ
jgi:hypothetical protein